MLSYLHAVSVADCHCVLTETTQVFMYITVRMEMGG